MAIEWAYLKERGGENFELMIATLMRREYEGLRQLTPAQGDGGIDLLLETPEGNRIWQVKGFTTPLNASQLGQVERSWARFNAEHVETGMKIVSYTLVTAWTPTAAKLTWFDELVGDPGFTTSWDGKPFLNGLAAAHPEVIALYEKGPAAFDEQVVAKALLAGSAPLGPPDTMRDAISLREGALRELRDGLHEHYRIDVSERTSTQPGKLPIPGPGEAGLMHRYENIGTDRWRVESVVPRHAQATEIDPITGRLLFTPEPGTDSERHFQEFRAWGVPLKDFEVEMETKGGPFPEPKHRGMISTSSLPPEEPLPDMVLTVVKADGQRIPALRLRVAEVTRGVEGNGFRIAAASLRGTTTIEVRVGSELADDQFLFSFAPTPGARPRDVVRELEWVRMVEGSEVLIEADGELTLARLASVRAPRAALYTLQVAEALTSLQPHAETTFLMPDITEVTDEDLRDLLWLAKIYGGEADERAWESLEVTVDDPEGLHHFTGTGTLAMTHAPTFTLGATSYAMSRELAYQFLTPTLGDGVAIDEVQPGQKVRLVPGSDARHIVAAVRD